MQNFTQEIYAATDFRDTHGLRARGHSYSLYTPFNPDERDMIILSHVLQKYLRLPYDVWYQEILQHEHTENPDKPGTSMLTDYVDKLGHGCYGADPNGPWTPLIAGDLI